jgi:hypothetical protein
MATMLPFTDISSASCATVTIVKKNLIATMPLCSSVNIAYGNEALSLSDSNMREGYLLALLHGQIGSKRYVSQ